MYLKGVGEVGLQVEGTRRHQLCGGLPVVCDATAPGVTDALTTEPLVGSLAAGSFPCPSGQNVAHF